MPRKHQDHLSIQKVRYKKINWRDMEELECILFEEGS